MSIRRIPYSDHDEWLQIRRQYIGGSDAGAVMGMNPYSSPTAVWAEKTGRTEPFSGNLKTLERRTRDSLLRHGRRERREAQQGECKSWAPHADIPPFTLSDRSDAD